MVAPLSLPSLQIKTCQPLPQLYLYHCGSLPSLQEGSHLSLLMFQSFQSFKCYFVRHGLCDSFSPCSLSYMRPENRFDSSWVHLSLLRQRFERLYLVFHFSFSQSLILFGPKWSFNIIGAYLSKIFGAIFFGVFFLTLIWRRRMISLVRCNLALFINHFRHARRFLQFANFLFFFLIFLFAKLFGVLGDTFALDLRWLTLPSWMWFQLFNSGNFVLLVSTCTGAMHHFDKLQVRRRYWFEFGTIFIFRRILLLFLLCNLKFYLCLVHLFYAFH